MINQTGTLFLSVAILLGVAIGLILARLLKRKVGGKAKVAIALLIASSFWPVFAHVGTFWNAERWRVADGSFKPAVELQPVPADGTLRHQQWDSWGFPGAGSTIVYLVYDPRNGLQDAARRGRPGKFNGLPCEVQEVQRLESNWYLAMFYAGDSWERCR